MKDKFYYVLKDCLSNRQSWVRETEIYFKFRHLKEKANNKIFEGNIILKILHKLINLPLNSLLFIKKVKEYYEYNQTLKEIEIINSEIEKYELEKSKTGKWMPNKKKKSAKIINFINSSKRNNKIQTEDSEIKRMDKLAKELVDVYYDSATKSFLDVGYCFYFFIYRVLQRMIASTSFPVYQNYFKGAAKEILKNYDQWIEKYKDWDGASINDKVEGSNKPRNESDTIH